MYFYRDFVEKVHRLIPSHFPPVNLFDWASSAKELEQIAKLEGLTNDRMLAEYGKISLVAEEDWISGPGSTPIMAAFTHIGYESRFSDGSFGLYYAASSLETAIKETIFHREMFYKASKERACSITMREYIGHIQKPLVDLSADTYKDLFNPNPACYKQSQDFGKKLYTEKEWGIIYPSVRNQTGLCLAILRPPALTIPTQGCHLRYIWDGEKISAVYKQSKLRNVCKNTANLSR